MVADIANEEGEPSRLAPAAVKVEIRKFDICHLVVLARPSGLVQIDVRVELPNAGMGAQDTWHAIWFWARWYSAKPT